MDSYQFTECLVHSRFSINFINDCKMMENWQNEYITKNNNTDLLNKGLFDELLVK